MRWQDGLEMLCWLILGTLATWAVATAAEKPAAIVSASAEVAAQETDVQELDVQETGLRDRFKGRPNDELEIGDMPSVLEPTPAQRPRLLDRPIAERPIADRARNRERPILNWFRGLFSGGANFIGGLIRLSFWMVVIAAVLALYIGPTILTPLKYDWPLVAIKAIWNLFKK